MNEHASMENDPYNLHLRPISTPPLNIDFLFNI